MNNSEKIENQRYFEIDPDIDEYYSTLIPKELRNFCKEYSLVGNFSWMSVYIIYQKHGLTCAKIRIATRIEKNMKDIYGDDYIGTIKRDKHV